MDMFIFMLQLFLITFLFVATKVIKNYETAFDEVNYEL